MRRFIFEFTCDNCGFVEEMDISINSSQEGCRIRNNCAYAMRDEKDCFTWDLVVLNEERAKFCAEAGIAGKDLCGECIKKAKLAAIEKRELAEYERFKYLHDKFGEKCGTTKKPTN